MLALLLSGALAREGAALNGDETWGLRRRVEWSSDQGVFREFAELEGPSDGSYLQFGSYVALSDDGKVTAVGNGRNTVRVYNRTLTGNWVQVGSDISTPDTSWPTVAISSCGVVLVVGDYSGRSDGKGQVLVLDLKNEDWVQRGSVLPPTTAAANGGAYANIGWAVSVSGDGSVVAFGDREFDSKKGQAQVWRWNSTQWVERGQSLEGKSTNDYFGHEVDLSRDGDKLVVGAYFGKYSVYYDLEPDTPQYTYSGYAQVFSWMEGSQSWNQLGPDLVMAATEIEFNPSYFGSAVALSGKRVAVGAKMRMAVEVFELSSDNSSWDLVGDTIYGSGQNDNLGGKGRVALSDDGQLLLVSSYEHDSSRGHARLFEWNASSWELVMEVNGNGTSDWFGMNVAITPSGRTWAAGAPQGGSNDQGSVRTFDWGPPPTAAPTSAPTSDPTAAPTSDPTAAPTSDPTADPTAAPTSDPTVAPEASSGMATGTIVGIVLVAIVVLILIGVVVYKTVVVGGATASAVASSEGGGATEMGATSGDTAQRADIE